MLISPSVRRNAPECFCLPSSTMDLQLCTGKVEITTKYSSNKRIRRTLIVTSKPLISMEKSYLLLITRQEHYDQHEDLGAKSHTLY